MSRLRGSSDRGTRRIQLPATSRGGGEAGDAGIMSGPRQTLLEGGGEGSL